MEIIISSNTSKPIYEQITSQMKAMIMSGDFKPATRFRLCGHWQSRFISASLQCRKPMKICIVMALLKQQ